MIEKSLEEGNIYLFGTINTRMAVLFQYKIDWFLQNKFKEINIFINSEGGSVEDALSIVDRINLIRDRMTINCIGLGQVASAAIFILVAGTGRYCTENTTFLAHGVTHTITEYHSHLEKYTKFQHHFYNNLMTDLAMKCGKKTPKAIKAFLRQVNDTVWMDMEEATKLGLIQGEWKNRGTVS